MEHRIATLLGDSGALDRATLDPILLLPLPPLAPLRPHPVEPSPVADDARTPAATLRGEHTDNERAIAGIQASAPQGRQKPGAPLAEVLNDETSSPADSQSLPVSVAAPFSGRLSDILLDPSQPYANKRRKVDSQTASPVPTGNENTLLRLPRPPPLPPKKTARRNRIPPLLQGLHQPPSPPPQDRLFPPITGDGGRIGRSLGDRVGLQPPTIRDRDEDSDNTVEEDTAPTGARTSVWEGRKNPVSIPVPAGCTEASGQRNAGHGSGKAGCKAKEIIKKRNKWSEQETKDLLHGVSKFGIGNWKKILNCADFHFDNRSAVDLKDRFRICCPGDGLKRKNKKPNLVAAAVMPQGGSSLSASSPKNHSGEDDIASSLPPKKSKPMRKPRSDRHEKGPAELAEMGIEGPFAKSNRRERHGFTEADDANLLRGYETYGSSWRQMRDDISLGFSKRHATDLRDRFRNRYPDKYAEAKSKTKPKDQSLANPRKPEKANKHGPADSNPPSRTPEDISSSQTVSAPEIRTTTVAALASVSALRAHALRQSLLTSFPGSLDDFTDLISEDGEGGRSPITLSRNIFEWADANPSSLNTVSSTTAPLVGSLTADVSFNLYPGMDGMHIDPLVTLKLPTTNSALSAIPSNTSAPPFITNLASVQSSTSTATISSMPTSTATSKQNIDPLLRTPNLPTIVYPHVPVASARSAMHNLPPPADLLSGLEVDGRIESASSGFMLDDGMGFGFAIPYAAPPTLAPIIGGANVGRTVLPLDRGLWDEPFGERSVLNSSV
jgi:hypothetical protein